MPCPETSFATFLAIFSADFTPFSAEDFAAYFVAFLAGLRDAAFAFTAVFDFFLAFLAN